MCIRDSDSTVRQRVGRPMKLQSVNVLSMNSAVYCLRHLSLIHI